MARTSVTPTTQGVTSDIDLVATATTIDSTLVTNGVKIVGAANLGTWKCLVIMRNTAGSSKAFTFQSGADRDNGGAALNAGKGDEVVTVDATSGMKSIVLESSQFAQSDGSFWLDFASGTTGYLNVIALP